MPETRLNPPREPLRTASRDLQGRGAAPLLDDAGSDPRTGAKIVTRVASSRLFGYVASFVFVVVVWQLAVVVLAVEEFVLPAPAAVGERIVSDGAVLWEHTLVTLREILIGFGIAAVSGIALGTVISLWTPLERLVYPLLVSSQAVPKVALAPLFVIWFGFGAVTNALIAVLIAIFPIVINTTLGLRAIDPDMVRLGRVMGGTKWRVFARIRLPNSLPSVFAGLKLGITFATIGAVVGEFVGSTAGLGYISQQAAGTLDTVLAFASLVILAVLGVLLFIAVEAVERIMLRWHVSEEAW